MCEYSFSEGLSLLEINEKVGAAKPARRTLGTRPPRKHAATRTRASSMRLGVQLLQCGADAPAGRGASWLLRA